MEGAICAALSASTRGRSLPRASDPRAIDLLRPCRLGRVPGARDRRGLADSADRAGPHIFVTRSRTPYECAFSSPVGEELEIIQVHIAVDQFLAALEAAYRGKTEEVEVIDYFGRDEALTHLCFACSAMLSARTPGKSRRIADLAHLLASYLVEKYIDVAAEKPDFYSGLPIWQLRNVED